MAKERSSISRKPFIRQRILKAAYRKVMQDIAAFNSSSGGGERLDEAAPSVGFTASSTAVNVARFMF